MALEVDQIVEGTVSDIMDYGVFVKLEDGKTTGLVHISEVSREYVEDIHDVLKVGDIVKVKVLSTDKKLSLSIRKALPYIPKERKSFQSREKSRQPVGPLTLDDMLSKFMKDSDERQLDLKRNIESKRGTSKRR